MPCRTTWVSLRHGLSRFENEVHSGRSWIRTGDGQSRSPHVYITEGHNRCALTIIRSREAGDRVSTQRCGIYLANRRTNHPVPLRAKYVVQTDHFAEQTPQQLISFNKGSRNTWHIRLSSAVAAVPTPLLGPRHVLLFLVCIFVLLTTRTTRGVTPVRGHPVLSPFFFVFLSFFAPTNRAVTLR